MTRDREAGRVQAAIDRDPPLSGEEGPDLKLVGEEASLDLGELDQLLEQSEGVLEGPVDVSAALAERSDITRAIETTSTNLEDARRQLQKAEPIPELLPDDYEALVGNSIIDPTAADRLTRLDEQIGKFEAIEDRTGVAEIQYQALKEAKNQLAGQIEAAVARRREKLTAERERQGQALVELSEGELAGLRARLAKLEEDPVIQKRLAELAGAEKEKSTPAKQVAAEEARQKQEQTQEQRLGALTETTRNLDYVRGRHDHTFATLATALGDESARAELVGALDSSKAKERWAVIDPLRDRLIEHIITAEGGDRITKPGDILPFADRRSDSISYAEASSFLDQREVRDNLDYLVEGDNEQARELRAALSITEREREAMRMLFQGKFRKRGEKEQLNPFWQAFETRKENDAKGETERLRAATEESIKKAEVRTRQLAAEQEGLATAEREAATREREAIEGILSRGGFMVTVPEYSTVENRWGKKRQVQTGSHEAFARIGTTESKKGGTLLSILETHGDLGGHKVGDTSTPNGINFRGYLTNAMAQNFLRGREGDFTTIRWVTEAQKKAGESIEGEGTEDEYQTLFPVSWGTRGSKRQFIKGKKKWDPSMAQVDRKDKEERMLAEEEESEGRERRRAEELAKKKKAEEEAAEKAAKKQAAGKKGK